jgi:hypothetical protein
LASAPIRVNSTGGILTLLLIKLRGTHSPQALKGLTLQNFFQKFYQKCFAKIRFAERTCAKKGNLFPSGKNITYAGANFFSSQTF